MARFSMLQKRWIEWGPRTAYLACILLLGLWESRELVQYRSADCADTVFEPHSAEFNWVYGAIFDWMGNQSHSDVSLVSLDRNLKVAQYNACRGRAYLADVLTAVEAQRPGEIMLDKFYEPGTCPDGQDKIDSDQLKAVVRAMPVPVVIAESTDLAEGERSDACLVAKPQMAFEGANVLHGLARLNKDVLEIPLRWKLADSGPTIDSAGAAEEATAKEPMGPIQLRDTLAMVSFETFAPDAAEGSRFADLLHAQRPAYANVNVRLPRETSTDLLCSAGDPAVRAKWGVDCSKPKPALNLLGRVVVIGSISEADKKDALGKKLDGFDLQGRYIEALLTGNYLRSTPAWASIVLFFLFILLAELLPEVLQQALPRVPMLRHAHGRYWLSWVAVWVMILGVVLVMLFLTVEVCLHLHFMPPLLLVWLIGVSMVTKSIFGLAERSGEQLHHRHEGRP